MRILLTNDDGVNATGLKVLETIARTLSDDIWIVAPAEEKSGAGHSLTLTQRCSRHETSTASMTLFTPYAKRTSGWTGCPNATAVIRS